MGRPIFAWKRGITSGTITASSTESGFSVNDIKDFKPYSVWKAGSLTSPQTLDMDRGAPGEAADYVAFVNHNLHNLGTTVEIRADTFTPPTTVRATITPSNGSVTYQAFTNPGALRYWRVAIIDSAPPFASAPYIGELWLGLKTELPEFLAPDFDPFFDDVEVSGERSDGGNYLAAILRGHSHRGTIQFGAAGAVRASFTSDLSPFIDQHANRGYPWIFIVDPDDSDFSTPRYIKKQDGTRVGRHAVGGAWSRLTFRIDVEEALMEPVL